MILAKEYVAIFENPSQRGQYVFLILIKGYIHAVPFVNDEENNIILKTIFPSRKFNTMYGEASDGKEA